LPKIFILLNLFWLLASPKFIYIYIYIYILIYFTNAQRLELGSSIYFAT
jgi:hypothetical protein